MGSLSSLQAGLPCDCCTALTSLEYSAQKGAIPGSCCRLDRTCTRVCSVSDTKCVQAELLLAEACVLPDYF